MSIFSGKNDPISNYKNSIFSKNYKLNYKLSFHHQTSEYIYF